MHVVIVDEEIPFPMNSGKRIRTYNLVSRLASRHRLTYLCPCNRDANEAARAEEQFRSLGIETVFVDHCPPRKSGLAFYARLALNLLSPLPYSVQVHNSPAMERAVRDCAARHRPDLWHCEWTPYAQSVVRAGVAPWVVMAHNVESLIWQRYFENEGNPLKRWYLRRQWQKYERFERRVLAEAAQMIAVSERDAALARARFDARRVSVVDNGVDLDYFHPRLESSRSETILYLGSLDWRPNLDAAELLLTQIFPDVLREEPAAKLQIVGRRPPRWLGKLVQSCPNAQVHADVTDVRPFLWQCGVMAVPLRIGGGSRLKILEALACECPVVSTRVGAEGLHLTAGRHFVEVPEVHGMASALVRALREPAASAAQARAGREVVQSLYDWDALAEKLDTIWTGHCSRVPAARQA